MDKKSALSALSALGQDTRLEVFRLLVKTGDEGVPAGEIAARLGAVQNTMSAHLSILSRAGLIVAERQSRSIIYRVDLTVVRSLVLYLLRDCCGGKPDLCAPVIEALAPCCAEGGSCD